MRVLEPDVTFTDYALAIECAVLAALVVRCGAPGHPLRGWFVAFFATIGLAAVTGGTVHGFFPDEQSLGFRALWPVSLVAIGGTAVSAWAIGGRLVLSDHAARFLIGAAWIVFGGYVVIVLAVTQSFAVAIAHYAPSALFLLGAFAIRYAKKREPGPAAGLAAVALMLGAALVQRSGVGVHPLYFNHNALYHLLQGVSLILLYFAARHLLGSPTQGE